MDHKLTLIVDETETQVDAKEEGRTILDFAIIAGANPPYSCMEGSCANCEAQVLEGEVRVLEGFEVEGHPSQVKTCQSFPKTFPLKIKY